MLDPASRRARPGPAALWGGRAAAREQCGTDLRSEFAASGPGQDAPAEDAALIAGAKTWVWTPAIVQTARTAEPGSTAEVHIEVRAERPDARFCARTRERRHVGDARAR